MVLYSLTDAGLALLDAVVPVAEVAV